MGLLVHQAVALLARYRCDLDTLRYFLFRLSTVR
jgi:hypothetical protein